MYKMPRKSNKQYTVTHIDVDGDGVPDGALVTEYTNKKMTSQKFVPNSKLKTIAKNAIANSSSASPQRNTIYNTNTNTLHTATKTKQKVVYKRMPPVEQTDQPVMIQNESSFGHYVKAGAGMTVGSTIVNSLVDGLSSLFGSGGDGE